MMKTIFKVLYPIGYEIHEVEDDFPTALPFVEVAPLDSLKISNHNSSISQMENGKKQLHKITLRRLNYWKIFLQDFKLIIKLLKNPMKHLLLKQIQWRN